MSSSEGGHLQSWFEFAFPGPYESLVALVKKSGEYWASVNPLFEPCASDSSAALGANTIFGSWLVCFVLIAAAVVGRMGLNAVIARQGATRFHADNSLNPRTFFEVYTSFIHDLAADSLGRKDARKFYWLIGGMFLYILLNNLIGVLPGGIPPSQSISNNTAMSIVVLVVFVGVGLSRQGAGFFKHMMGPVWYLAPLIFVIEMIGTFGVRPLSLSVRLTGNLNGDHIVLGIVSGLVPYVLPVMALCLGIFVSFIQAFVFTLLSIVYISLSKEQDDH
jgi:F-type H+-transporting ATPase subunit a